MGGVEDVVSAGGITRCKRLQWVAKTSPVLKDLLPQSRRRKANGSQPSPLRGGSVGLVPVSTRPDLSTVKDSIKF